MWGSGQGKTETQRQTQKIKGRRGVRSRKAGREGRAEGRTLLH